jgi:hypothetical protein
MLIEGCRRCWKLNEYTRGKKERKKMALQRIEPRTKGKPLHKLKVHNHYTNQALKGQPTLCISWGQWVPQAAAIKCAEVRRHQIPAFRLPRCGGKSGVVECCLNQVFCTYREKA